MSSSQKINRPDHSTDVQPTPQNTPLDNAVLANRPANMGKPQVEDIGEGEEDDDEDVGAMNPASLLAKVSVACNSLTSEPRPPRARSSQI
jgi:nucleosome assembly protein 1-like 1